ncbi:MAG: ATP-binding protein, partial [Firmicutes bacterium]|nr:ATP-binding protein [Bacillota bacterium]
KYPTIGLAWGLYLLTDIVPDTAVYDIRQEGRVIKKLLFDGDRNGQDTFLAQKIKLPAKVVAYVSGSNKLSEDIAFFAEYIDPQKSPGEVFINKKAIDGLKSTVDSIIESGEPTILQLYGPRGTGKMFAVRHLAAGSKHRILALDIDKILLSEKGLLELTNKAIAEAVCEDRIICLKNIPALNESNSVPIKTMIDLLREYFKVLIITSDEKDVYDFSLDFRILQIEYKMPDFSERLLLWKEFLKEKQIGSNLDIEDIANKFILSPRQIKNVILAAGLSGAYAGRKEIITEDIVGAVRAQSLNRLKERASNVAAFYSWDDLVAEPEQKNMMLFAINYVKYKNKVNSDWGFGKKQAYGKGLSVLFYGPPGTGKTMAAQVMAKELGLELFKVDLSQMVSKYIGETEKNLSELFNEARYSNAILFFDEADALFSKRTEVTDSKDKYSNVETSFLLQKIEEYEGVAILASNYLVNFDDAFKRRIKFIINFQMPGPKMRYTLWEKTFPKEAPTDGLIDFDFLAETFEFTGSNIKNVVIAAAYMAAAENEPISMKHIVSAIKVENAKFGKVLLKHEFGRYAQYY